MILQQIADTSDLDIRWRKAGEDFGITGVVTLPNENSCYTRTPDFFHRGQDSQFVVHQNVMLSRIALLDIIELLLLVHVNQHASGDGIGQSRSTDLKRLENDVAVGE